MNKSQVASKVRSIRREENRPASGVIDTIVDILHAAKDMKQPLTTSEIGSVLSGMFPDRDGDGMLTTVRVQLSRLPHERKLRIKKVRDGATVRYLAA